ncbi:MAG: Alpha/Beta hydrolase protein [Monoraphidium minutum]|nr:MAG: Alpha/Beta hydrolase protein [Monoraphidium minutum]
MASEAPASTGKVLVDPEEGVEIYYELYENLCSDQQQQRDAVAPPPARVLLIMGVAATCVAWHTQIHALLARARALGRAIQVTAYDNRGVGRSGCPKDRRRYGSATMARDAAALMDALGWRAAHVVGFSMGTQIAAKLASSVAPDRVLSLVMISTAAGGIHSLPRSLHAMRHSLRVLLARTLVARARADLRLHFTKATLHSVSSSSSLSAAAAAAAALESVGSVEAAGGGAGAAATSVAAASDASSSGGGGGGGAQAPLASSSSAAASAAAAPRRRQKEELIDEYVAHARAMPPQAKHGFHGHLHTVWHHKLAPEEKAALRAARFPVLFIHGMKDKVAPPAHAQRLSRELGAGLALLPGAHVVMREAAAQVNALLFDLVFGEPAPGRREVAPIPVHAALYNSGGGSGGAAVDSAAEAGSGGKGGRVDAGVVAISASGLQAATP